MVVVEDWLEQLPTDQCAELFSYVEAREAVLTEVRRATDQSMVANTGKGLILLRLCNELLRRLSKTYMPHNALAGRILAFLSAHYPVNERSGVNLKGEFHGETAVPLASPAAGSAMDEDEASTPTAMASNPNFYTLFWSLQQYFAKPTLLFQTDLDSVPGAAAASALHLHETASPMRTFQAATKAVLPVMQHYNTTNSTPPKAETPNVSLHPAYLTDRSLLPYELSDVTFRRHILAQFLVLFHFLLGCTASSREQSASWPNKLLVLPGPLSESDEQWTRDAWREVQTQLRSSGADGGVFLTTLLTLLKRETSWIQWKGVGAPALEKAPLDQPDAVAYAEKEHAAFKARLAQYPHALGTPALSVLWHEGFTAQGPSSVDVADDEGHTRTVPTDGLEALEFPTPNPSLTALSRSIHMETQRMKQRRAALGKDLADDALAHMQNTQQSLVWRALRCAGPTRLHLFSCMENIDDIPGLLRAIQDEEQEEPYDAPVLYEPVEEDDKRERHAEADAKAKAEQEEKERIDKQKADKQKADQEKAAQEKADQEKADQEQADKEKADKEQAKKEKAERKAEKEQAKKDKAERKKRAREERRDDEPEHEHDEVRPAETQAGRDSPSRPPAIGTPDVTAYAEHDTDDDESQMDVDALDTLSVHTAEENGPPSMDDDAHDPDATFLTAPHGGRSSGESSRESTPVPLRSESGS